MKKLLLGLATVAGAILFLAGPASADRADRTDRDAERSAEREARSEARSAERANRGNNDVAIGDVNNSEASATESVGSDPVAEALANEGIPISRRSRPEPEREVNWTPEPGYEAPAEEVTTNQVATPEVQAAPAAVPSSSTTVIPQPAGTVLQKVAGTIPAGTQTVGNSTVQVAQTDFPGVVQDTTVVVTGPKKVRVFSLTTENGMTTLFRSTSPV